MHVGIFGFCGNRDAHDYEHSLIPIAIEVSHSFSVRPCSPLSMGRTGIPEVSTGLQQTYSDGGIRIPIPLQTAKGMNRCNQKNLIRLTIFPLMQYVYANGMRRTNTTKSCTICRNMLDAEGRRVGIDNGPILRAICSLPQEVAYRGCRTCRFAQIDVFMAFCQCIHICSVRLRLLFHIGTIPTVGNMPSVWGRLPLAVLGPPKH